MKCYFSEIYLPSIDVDIDTDKGLPSLPLKSRLGVRFAAATFWAVAALPKSTFEVNTQEVLLAETEAGHAFLCLAPFRCVLVAGHHYHTIISAHIIVDNHHTSPSHYTGCR